MSIRKKLFAMILLILLLNFLLLVLLGSTLFSRFYEGNKERELKNTAQQLSDIYSQNTEASWEELYQQIASEENRNNEIMIFRYSADGGQSPEMLYHSRMKNATVAYRIEMIAPLELPEPAEITPPMPIEPAQRFERTPFVPIYNAELLGKLPSLNLGDIVSNTDSSRYGSRISIVSRLDSDIYLMMETPREYINETAELAVQYSAFISIGVLFAGALVIYWLSGRFTRPIREIDAVAQQIAQLDFSASCPPAGGDEIGALAASINHMSGELQGNMERLVEANRVLQDDLTRQQETDRMRRQFVSDVSHDFKTPLTLMIGYAEAIRDGHEPARIGEYCDIIADEGNRLSRLVGRLLRLSRLESGMETPEYSIFSLNQLLDDTAHALQLPAGAKDIAIARSYCGELVVRADYQKLEQVVQNLLENAVKYAPMGATVQLTTQPCGEELCCITVHNSGSHIAESELESIFASFYRADRARDRAGSSYGLGLAIVQTILELHGQQCTAQNTADGVRFSFCLPTVALDEDEAEDDD